MYDKGIKCTSFYKEVAIHETETGRFEIDSGNESFSFASLEAAQRFVDWTVKMPEGKLFQVKSGNETVH